MKFGFIGLGQMGFGMVVSLLNAGREVTVCTRTRPRPPDW
jgi:3-hydroxyisobutyrate dehydrogenase-like beta-hydroxyacid dehydrogenase